MALKLGKSNVDEMLRGMSSSQWLEWKTMMVLTPFVMEQERADVRAALIAMSIWNVQISKGTKKGSAPSYREVHEFLMRWGDAPDPKPKRSPETQFQSVVDSFESLGLRPVNQSSGETKRDVDSMGRPITSSQVNNT